MIKGIGINIDTKRINGSITRFENELAFFQSVGFDYVELPPAGLDVIYWGKIREKQVGRVKKILSKFKFRYTVHTPDPVNLKDKMDVSHREVMEATIEFAHEVGAEVIVYHLGEFYSDSEITEKEQESAEVEDLRQLADIAHRYGILIGAENLTQTMSDVNKFIELVDHPALRVVMDVGHLFLACNYLKVDFLEQIEIGLKYAVELHVHDNFGKLPSAHLQNISNNESFSFTYGIGDLHLPPGEGVIPFDKVFSLTKASQFDGVITVEMNSKDRFEDDYARTLKFLREKLL